MDIISWEHFEEYIKRGIAALIGARTRSGAQLFVADGARAVGLRVPVQSQDTFPQSPYREINIEIKTVPTGRVVEVTTEAAPLFRKFYLFSVDVLELIERTDMPVPLAIQSSLQSWGELLSRKEMLSAEAQLGLYGELVFLEALIAARGEAALDAWVGPSKERHDFRIKGDEFEVKSTRRNDRVHMIHGLTQLEPSLGDRLFLVSMHFELAGANNGRALPDQVAAVARLLSNGSKSGEFMKQLEAIHYRPEDELHYSEAIRLRSKPQAILVDSAFPRITSATLGIGLRPALFQRIDRVSYEVDVGGIGGESAEQAYSAFVSR